FLQTFLRGSLMSTLVTLSIASQRKTILVIDDEDEVRELIVEVARRRGFEVLQAGNVTGALLICDRVAFIDLVVSDYNMPGGNGLILAEAIKRRWPSIRMVFMTGN